MIKIEIPFDVPSKKNTYEIHFRRDFWQAIQSIVGGWRTKYKVKKLFWIGPSKAVKDFEQNAAWIIYQAVNGKIEGEVEVRVIVYLKRWKDTDNLLGCIGDAMQKGIPGFNDRQIRRWIVERKKDKRARVELEINKF